MSKTGHHTIYYLHHKGGDVMDVYVYTYPLPGIREVARANEDGTYTVLVNECLCHEQKLDAVNHALGHVANEDWSKGGAVGSIEAEAHSERAEAPNSRFNLSDEEIPIFALKRAERGLSDAEKEN